MSFANLLGQFRHGLPRRTAAMTRPPSRLERKTPNTETWRAAESRRVDLAARLLRLGLLLVGFVAGGCYQTDVQSSVTSSEKPACRTDVAQWTEEVKLHDERIVTVWRRATKCSSGFPNARRGRDIEFELKFDGVHWKGPSSRRAVSFDLFGGIPHLVALVGDRDWCRNKSPDDYEAVFLRWANGRWEELPAGEYPIDNSSVNLSAYYWGHTAEDDFKGLIRWDIKRKTNGDHLGNPSPLKSYLDQSAHRCRTQQQTGQPRSQ
jgi:hypothetical protein